MSEPATTPVTREPSGRNRFFPGFLRRKWRHKVRGSQYQEFGRAELQASAPIREGATLVVYRGEDGRMWAREESEFHDGRFEEVQP